MIDLGLTSGGLAGLIRTLASDHQIRARVDMLDMEHRWVSHVGHVVGGQVNIDASAEVTRQLQISFVDAKKSVKVDASDGRPELRRMLQVHYDVYVPGGGVDGWVSIPVFTGPITRVERDGELATVEALGKEHLLRGPAWKSKTYAKGHNRVALIRALLNLKGERMMRLPKGWTARTIKPVTITRESSVWNQIQVIAKGSQAQVFYDGRGVCRMRRTPVRSAFTFRDGDGGMLLSTPRTSEAAEDVINLVHVVGAVPVGKKNPLVFTAKLPASHPHSGASLGRAGEPRDLPETIEDDSLRTQKEVESTARRRLREVLLDEQVVSFDSLPLPLLEELDPFTVDAKNAKATGRLLKMVIPLGHAQGASSVGYLAPASRRRR